MGEIIISCMTVVLMTTRIDPRIRTVPGQNMSSFRGVHNQIMWAVRSASDVRFFSCIFLQSRDGASPNSPTRQILFVTGAKRHGVFGESHDEG